MPRSLVVVNQRGGVGKTTTALAFAHYLVTNRRHVLLIDLDGQDSISRLLRLEKHERTIFDVLESSVSWRDCTVCLSEYLHVIPADRRLGRIEALLADRFRKQEILKRELLELTEDDSTYDAVVIDCSPSLSVLHSNAFSAATDVLLPVSMDLLAISGANAVLAHLKDFKKYCGYGPVAAGVLPTIFDQRQRIDKELLPIVRKAFAALHVFEPIRIDTKIRQATLRGGNIFETPKPTRGAQDYARFASDFLQRRWPHLITNGIEQEVLHAQLH